MKLNQQNAEFALDELKGLAESMGVSKVASHLLDDPRFIKWSGAGKFNQHHYGTHGLIIHTLEVVKTCLATADLYPQYEIDRTELFLAALFHDAGKMYDYEERLVKKLSMDYYEWTSTEHKRKIHHISRSALIWQEALLGQNDEFKEKYFDPVLHAILAHHGQREWGSPVMPKSRVAWLLHLCDGISARLNDADSWDMVERK